VVSPFGQSTLRGHGFHIIQNLYVLIQLVVKHRAVAEPIVIYLHRFVADVIFIGNLLDEYVQFCFVLIDFALFYKFGIHGINSYMLE